MHRRFPPKLAESSSATARLSSSYCVFAEASLARITDEMDQRGRHGASSSVLSRSLEGLLKSLKAEEVGSGRGTTCDQGMFDGSNDSSWPFAALPPLEDKAENEDSASVDCSRRKHHNTASDLCSLALKSTTADREFELGMAKYFEGDDSQARLHFNSVVELREAIEGDIAAPELFDNDTVLRQRHLRQTKHATLCISDMVCHPKTKPDLFGDAKGGSGEVTKKRPPNQGRRGLQGDDGSDAEDMLIEEFMSPSERRAKLPSFSNRHLVDSDIEDESGDEEDVEESKSYEAAEDRSYSHDNRDDDEGLCDLDSDDDESRYSLPAGYEFLHVRLPQNKRATQRLFCRRCHRGDSHDDSQDDRSKCVDYRPRRTKEYCTRIDKHEVFGADHGAEDTEDDYDNIHDLLAKIPAEGSAKTESRYAAVAAAFQNSGALTLWESSFDMSFHFNEGSLFGERKGACGGDDGLKLFSNDKTMMKNFAITSISAEDFGDSIGVWSLGMGNHDGHGSLVDMTPTTQYEAGADKKGPSLSRRSSILLSRAA